MSDIDNIGNFLNLNNASISDEEMIKILTEKVTKMLDTDTELLMSYLYRLDIEEHKINAVLNQPKSMPIAQGLASLIWKRQKQRIASKKKYKQDPIEGWEF